MHCPFLGVKVLVEERREWEDQDPEYGSNPDLAICPCGGAPLASLLTPSDLVLI